MVPYGEKSISMLSGPPSTACAAATPTEKRHATTIATRNGQSILAGTGELPSTVGSEELKEEPLNSKAKAVSDRY
jgi:hypothetical protein